MSEGSLGQRFWSYVIPVAILVAIDQLTKNIALEHLKDSASVVLVPQILYLLYTENTGVAFGLFSGHGFVFIAVAIIISLAISFYALWMPYAKRFMPLRICLSFTCAGAIGNLIDRIHLGYVIDFIYFKPIDFPVFNFADICVTVSVFFLIFLFIFVYKDSDIIRLDIFKTIKRDG